MNVPVSGSGAPAAHDRQAVRVVDIVCFDAVNDLHVPDDVLLLALLRVKRLGKGLRDAVVGDGHGAVAPHFAARHSSEAVELMPSIADILVCRCSSTRFMPS